MPLHGFRSPAYMGFEWKPIVATGGTITTTSPINGVIYKVHEFKTVGTSTFTVTDAGSTGEVEYLVIAGGGGSGGSKDDVTLAGGGGAGGYRCNVQGEMSGGGQPAEARKFLTAGSYTVVVGAGGSGATSGTTGGNNGGNSTFHDITALGGGAKTSYFTKPANPGGSGGGCGNGEDSGGAGEFGQGYDGGYSGKYGTAAQVGGTGAGGGGGAGGPGYPGTSSLGNGTDQGELKANVSCATTENVSLSSPPSSIDGVTLTEGMRVLVKDQDNASKNGIYTYSSGALSRATDMNAANETAPGSYTEVTSGTVNAGTKWGLAPGRALPVLNTTDLIWEKNAPKPPRGGKGGVGVTSSITGSAVGRAGGGGGSSSTTAGTATDGGAAGRTGTNNGIAGTANTGGGAGGSAFWSTDGTISAKKGAAGGSGIVIIRYPYQYV